MTEKQLSRLEEAIKLYFIPSLTGHSGITAQERHLISLPTRLEGLGIIDHNTAITEENATLDLKANGV